MRRAISLCVFLFLLCVCCSFDSWVTEMAYADSGSYARSLSDKREKILVEKEGEFRKNPSDFNAVLGLADAYAAMDDVSSAFLALALYEGLAQSSPSDLILGRLADAYGRLSLYDKAFTVAFRRSWNPLVSPVGAVSQIVFLSVASGEWDRGIEYLMSVLRNRGEEREPTLLALAALYVEKAGIVTDRSLREECLIAAEVCLDEVERDLPRSSAMMETALRLRKELDGR